MSLDSRIAFLLDDLLLYRIWLFLAQYSVSLYKEICNHGDHINSSGKGVEIFVLCIRPKGRLFYSMNDLHFNILSRGPHDGVLMSISILLKFEHYIEKLSDKSGRIQSTRTPAGVTSMTSNFSCSQLIRNLGVLLRIRAILGYDNDSVIYFGLQTTWKFYACAL